MTRVLAADTTSAFGSIALLEDGTVLEEIPLHSLEGFSAVLFDHIRQLLDRHEWAVNSVACFAAASGPGSFTGVRVGLTAVKGLAEAADRQAVGVSNLQALASYGSASLRGVVMDARRGEVYCAIYDSALRAAVPESVMPFLRWLETLPEGVGEIISPDFSAFGTAFTRHIPIIEQRTIASAVARIAYDRMQQGNVQDTAVIDANYVRRSDAEMFWKDR